METPYRRKRKLVPRTESQNQSPYTQILYLCGFIFLVLFFFFFSDGFFSIGSTVFHPVLIVSQFSSSPSASNSIQDSSSAINGFSPFRIEDQVIFPDHVMLLISKTTSLEEELDCIYFNNSKDKVNPVSIPVISVDGYDDSRSIARCPLPPSGAANHCSAVHLQTRRRKGDYGLLAVDQVEVHSWDMVVYEAVLDGDTVVAFVKGLNLRPDRNSDPTPFSCNFGWGELQRGNRFALTTKAVTAAQEVVRCSLPISIRNNPVKARGMRVTIGRGRTDSLPSVAKISYSNSQNLQKKEKYELCVCSMVWNQAPSIREWIVYHAWLGVERWFIYDNNSDDEIKEVIDELNQENFNVSRHVWPWVKTQEAGFSHCALKAKDECKWVGFMDVDEFFYFPIPTRNRRMMRKLGYPGRHSLRSLVSNFTSSTTIGEIRTACHSFGPSGLSTAPSQGVTVGYTCRLQSPERHKSIIRPDALQDTLLNVVHHFRLKTGFKYMNMPQSATLINHYKYQVWESFRAKFSRRVATYVVDWQENQNEGSKDRAPGLGTEAIEPPNWPLQFCEVWDTGLRDFVMANLADQASGVLPWENKSPL